MVVLGRNASISNLYCLCRSIAVESLFQSKIDLCSHQCLAVNDYKRHLHERSYKHIHISRIIVVQEVTTR